MSDSQGINWPADYYSDRVKFSVAGMRKLDRFLRASKTVVVTTGFLSKGKHNLRAKYFGTGYHSERAGTYRIEPRFPGPIFAKSDKLGRIMNHLRQVLYKTGIDYALDFSGEGRGASPFPLIREVWKKAFPALNEEFRESAKKTIPIYKNPQAHKDLTPLVESGKLLASVRTRFKRGRKLSEPGFSTRAVKSLRRTYFRARAFGQAYTKQHAEKQALYAKRLASQRYSHFNKFRKARGVHA